MVSAAESDDHELVIRQVSEWNSLLNVHLTECFVWFQSQNNPNFNFGHLIDGRLITLMTPFQYDSVARASSRFGNFDKTSSSLAGTTIAFNE